MDVTTLKKRTAVAHGVGLEKSTAHYHMTSVSPPSGLHLKWPSMDHRSRGGGDGYQQLIYEVILHSFLDVTRYD